jgi:ribosome-associated heat shock protein Hsp15
MTDLRQRLDKWLWYARFFKSRSIAARLCAARRVRVNHAVISKAHAVVKPGDVLTFPQGGHIRVVEVLAPGDRRGPAPEARALYNDLDPPLVSKAPCGATAGARERGSGRPTKADRRAISRLKGDP